LHYTLLVLTDGRGEYLQRAIKRANIYLPEPARRVMVNDNPSERWTNWLEVAYDRDFEIHNLKPKLGFSGAMQKAWEILAEEDTWVFHLEEDFLLEPLGLGETYPLDEMAALMEARPHLKQVLFKRPPWNQREIKAGGWMEIIPEAYVEKEQDGHYYVEQRQWFSLNPCLYHSSLCKEFKWPPAPASEVHFSKLLFSSDPEAACAVWGKKSDPPICEHIGLSKSGFGY
jgi:hypothetical protein